MSKLICFTSDRFNPTRDELEENADDYINPGVFRKELSDFLCHELESSGRVDQFSCSEDWGWYHELKHNEPFALVSRCSNYSEGHMIQFSPKTAYVRKRFKKYHALPKVDALRETFWKILENAEGISDLQYEKD